MTANANVQSLHDTVTARIISELEAGRFPWVQPWASSGGTPLGLPQNASTGRTYSGVNILLLWFAAIEQGRPSQRWLTFKQALALGGCVRKGEKGTMVVYADTFVPKAEQEKASASGEDARRVGFLKRFTVFHVDQCDGLAVDPDAAPLPGPLKCDPRDTLDFGTRIDHGVAGGLDAVDLAAVRWLSEIDPARQLANDQHVDRVGLDGSKVGENTERRPETK